MADLPGEANWIEWWRIPWREQEPGVTLDLLCALWVYEWRVRPEGEGDGAMLVSPQDMMYQLDPFSHPERIAGLPQYSTHVMWGWRAFCQAVLIADHPKGGVLLDLTEAEGDAHLSVDRLPVRVQVAGGEAWEGPLPWAATMAAIEIAEQARVARSAGPIERLGRWLKRRA